MARYIDVEALTMKLFPLGMIDNGNYTINAKAVKVAIDSISTTDVAPKSEVERLSKELDELAEEYSDLIIGKDRTFDEGERWYKEAKKLESEKDALIKNYAECMKDYATQLIDEMLDGLQFVIDQEDTLGRNALDQGDTTGYHIHQYAEERLEMLKTALLLWKATKGGAE